MRKDLMQKADTRHRQKESMNFSVNKPRNRTNNIGQRGSDSFFIFNFLFQAFLVLCLIKVSDIKCLKHA